jgi:hypothetical protein
MSLAAFVPYVDVWAFVPELWMCGLRAVYVLLAIELASFLQVLETSPYRGGSAEFFNL